MRRHADVTLGLVATSDVVGVVHALAEGRIQQGAELTAFWKRDYTAERAKRKYAARMADRRTSAWVATGERSGGRCEVVVRIVNGYGAVYSRCLSSASQVHHMIGGRGKRGIGESAKAERKQHVCAACHQALTDNKLVIFEGGPLPRYDDEYVRLLA